MKTIGLLGGMSWESSQLYYQQLNQLTRKKLGGLHSAKMILFSVDFAEIESLQAAEDWDGAAKLLIDAAQSLEKSGADFILIGTNTMHIVADAIANAITIPLLHIGNATAKELQRQSIKSTLLLGTRFTMEKDFYIQNLQDGGFIVSVPSASDRQVIHDVIYDELCMGIVSESSKARFLEIIAKHAEQGAQSVVLGCTEIGLLVKQHELNIPLFDTTAIHTEAAINYALQDE